METLMELENLYVKILRGELHAKSLPPLDGPARTRLESVKEKAADSAGPRRAVSLRSSTAWKI